MNTGDPLAFFITWSVYGSHLQGDERGWRRRRKGDQLPQPALATWRQIRLKHEVRLLSQEERRVVECACERHCGIRGWRLWAANARTNHVHVVVSAAEFSGATVRDQLKANCTRALRETSHEFVDRPVWTVGGDWSCVNTDEDLEIVCAYVTDAQDRMDRVEH
jgi:hypothetical protein